MRTVLKNHQEVAHVWAAQTQVHGNAGRMFFDGPSIYSYGRHFEIARFVSKNVVLFDNRRYSVSTAKHQSYTRRAVSHLRVFTVPYMDDHLSNAKNYISALENELYTLSRARVGLEWKRANWNSLADEAVRYCKEFKANIPVALQTTISALKKAGPLPSNELAARFKARALAEREETKARRLAKEKRDAEYKAERINTYEKWKAGEQTYHSFHDFPVALRVKDDEIQTSRGATIPVIEGKKLWRALSLGVVREGMRVGHYTVTRLEADSLVVGCHTIPLPEIKRVAELLGLEAGV